MGCLTSLFIEGALTVICTSMAVYHMPQHLTVLQDWNMHLPRYLKMSKWNNGKITHLFQYFYIEIIYFVVENKRFLLKLNSVSIFIDHENITVFIMNVYTALVFRKREAVHFNVFVWSNINFSILSVMIYCITLSPIAPVIPQWVIPGLLKD